MGRRIDADAVLEAYARTKNGREVARLLGIHENSVYQITRKANGECSRCKVPIKNGKTSCDACLDWDRVRVKKQRAERMRLGLRQSCSKQRSPLSVLYCEEHRIASAKRKQEHKRRKRAQRAGATKGTIPNDRQRLRSIRYSFGEAGVECWTEAKGACEICHVTFKEATIHIHHIDQNDKNSARSNLMCLCFECHNTTHRLLRLRNLKSLLTWFEATYPAQFAA